MERVPRSLAVLEFRDRVLHDALANPVDSPQFSRLVSLVDLIDLLDTVAESETSMRFPDRWPRLSTKRRLISQQPKGVRRSRNGLRPFQRNATAGRGIAGVVSPGEDDSVWTDDLGFAGHAGRK